MPGPLSPADSPLDELSELGHDALTEAVPTGVGAAAATLTELPDNPGGLLVPTIELLPAGKLLQSQLRDQHCAVSQSFPGAIGSAEASLVFPGDTGMQLSRAATRKDTALDEMTDVEQDGLLELGNVIINSCLRALSEVL